MTARVLTARDWSRPQRVDHAEAVQVMESVPWDRTESDNGERGGTGVEILACAAQHLILVPRSHAVVLAKIDLNAHHAGTLPVGLRKLEATPAVSQTHKLVRPKRVHWQPCALEPRGVWCPWDAEPADLSRLGFQHDHDSDGRLLLRAKLRRVEDVQERASWELP